MSQLTLLNKIADAICERRNADDWPCNDLDFDEEMARTAVKALENAFYLFPGPIGNLKDNIEWDRLLKIVIAQITKYDVIS